MLGKRRPQCGRGDVGEHQRDAEADRHERRDELGVARADAHREGGAGGAGRRAGAARTTISGRLPMRPPSAPVKGETASGRIVQGSVSTPATMAESPCTCVRYWMIRKKAANIVKCSPKPAPLAAAKPGRRKRASGSIGAAERRSCSTNAPSSAAPTAYASSVEGERPAVGVAASRRPHDAEQAAARVGEARAGRAVPGRRGSRVRRRGASAAAVRPTGTLIQKIQCQSSVSTMRPPSSGPSATPKPGDRRPQPERGRASLGREGGREQRQRERHEQRGPEALDGARDDELREVVRERAGSRGGREHEQPDDEHAPAAVAVAERGARQHEDGERRGCRRRRPTAGDRRTRPRSRCIDGSVESTIRLSSVIMKSDAPVSATAQM